MAAKLRDTLIYARGLRADYAAAYIGMGCYIQHRLVMAMMTLGNMRDNGVRSLTVTCGVLWCVMTLKRTAGDR